MVKVESGVQPKSAISLPPVVAVWLAIRAVFAQPPPTIISVVARPITNDDCRVCLPC
jgi:hypothetical protein